MGGSEIEVFFTEAFGLRHVKTMFLQAFVPVWQRIRRYGQAHITHLAAAFLGLDANVRDRERGEQRAFFTRVITVVQVVNRCCAIIEQRAFDAFQAQCLGVKIEVFLHVADANSDMVMTGQTRAWQFIGHDGYPPGKLWLPYCC